MTDHRAFNFSKQNTTREIYVRHEAVYRTLLKAYPSKLLEYINFMFQDAVSYTAQLYYRIWHFQLQVKALFEPLRLEG